MEYCNDQMEAVDVNSDYFVYFAASNKVVCAILVCRRNNVAFKNGDNMTKSNDEVECMVGVERIWVDKDFRRQSLATKLLDAMRDDYVYGLKIPKSKVAFSQPTESGRKLAESYCGKDFSVY